jgi:hypothetical protein
MWHNKKQVEAAEGVLLAESTEAKEALEVRNGRLVNGVDCR